VSQLPFVKFFPRDWLSDSALRTCSLATRGVWIDFLCVMHAAPIRGYLVSAAGTPMSVDQVSRLIGCSPAETDLLLAELLSLGVCDRTEDGAIISRRMVRDSAISDVRSTAGRRVGN
jgi:hypothetical protein